MGCNPQQTFQVRQSSLVKHLPYTKSRNQNRFKSMIRRHTTSPLWATRPAYRAFIAMRARISRSGRSRCLFVKGAPAGQLFWEHCCSVVEWCYALGGLCAHLDCHWRKCRERSCNRSSSFVARTGSGSPCHVGECFTGNNLETSSGATVFATIRSTPSFPLYVAAALPSALIATGLHPFRSIFTSPDKASSASLANLATAEFRKTHVVVMRLGELQGTGEQAKASSNIDVQAPTKYEPVLNLKIAKGRADVPATIFARADEVIE